MELRLLLFPPRIIRSKVFLPVNISLLVVGIVDPVVVLLSKVVVNVDVVVSVMVVEVIVEIEFVRVEIVLVEVIVVEEAGVLYVVSGSPT